MAKDHDGSSLATAVPTRSTVQGRLLASTDVAGKQVIATVSEDLRIVRLTIPGAAPTATIDLPPMAGRITEVQICPWLTQVPRGGAALAIEVTNDETKTVSYHWATVWLDPETNAFGTPVHDEFLATKTDHRLISIVNPPDEGDTIYILLAGGRQGEAGWEFDGYLYINACPVSPSINGSLFRVAATPEARIPAEAVSPPADKSLPK